MIYVAAPLVLYVDVYNLVFFQSILMFGLLLDLSCAALFKAATLLFDNVPQATKAIIDTQYNTDIERAARQHDSMDLDTSSHMSADIPQQKRATQCMCGCWRQGAYCPVVCLRSCQHLVLMRCKPRLAFLVVMVLFVYVFGAAVWIRVRNLNRSWPAHTGFQASVTLPPETISSAAVLDLRVQMLRYMDQNPSICGAAAADIGHYASYILLRVGEASHHHSCPSFAARCTEDEVMFEMINPRLVDHTQRTETMHARSHNPYTSSSIRKVKTQSLLCPTPCTREQVFETPVTVVFTSRHNSLHTLELRDQVAICFQHHQRVAEGEWPCAPCLETTPTEALQ